MTGPTVNVRLDGKAVRVAPGERLIITLPADSPWVAVETLVEALRTRGLRDRTIVLVGGEVIVLSAEPVGETDQ